MTFKSTVPFLTPEKRRFWFFKKIPLKFFFLDSALKTIDAQMFFWLVFLKMRAKKVIDRQKHNFGHVWRFITFFLCILKNTDQNNICAAIVFKAKTKEKLEEIFFLRFLF